MTNKEKAIQFLDLMRKGDKRCNAILMFMSALFMMNELEVLANIQRLATEP
ncbi:MAG TPA: hypothetical protein VFH31_05255 [Pyrinomonadaceae bacterium]|nr:hypothetical protein [Pyrinomonadaceae bacterium]